MPVQKAEITAKCTVTFDANLPANSTKIVNVTIDPVIGAKTEHVVPQDRDYIITDIYIKSSGDVGADCVVKFVKNGENELLQTDPVSTLLVSNPSRPRIPPLIFEAGSRMSLKAVNLEAIGTSAVTTTFYIKIAQREKAKRLGILERLSL